MPNASEKSSICRKLYAIVQALAPKTEYEEFCNIVDKRGAGYASGGAPYGVTWEEMGLEPWQDLEEEQ